MHRHLLSIAMLEGIAFDLWGLSLISDLLQKHFLLKMSSFLLKVVI